MGGLDNLLGWNFQLKSLVHSIILKETGFVLGCENSYRDARENRLYGNRDGETSGCSYSCPLTGGSY